MPTASLGPHRDLKNPNAIDPWKIRDLLLVAIGLPGLLAVMFFAFFFGLGNGN